MQNDNKYFILDMICDIEKEEYYDGKYPKTKNTQQFAILSCIDFNGQKVAIKVDFNNYIYIKMMDFDSKENVLNIIQEQYIESMMTQLGFKFDDFSIEKRKELFGYQPEQTPYVKLSFKENTSYWNALKICRNTYTDERANIVMEIDKFKEGCLEEDQDSEQFMLKIEMTAYETYLDDHIKIINTCDLRPCTWIEFIDNDPECVIEIENPHNTSVYLYVNKENIQTIDIKILKDPHPILNILSYDIETTTHHVSFFPNPCLYSNKIVQIGCVFQNSKTLEIRRYLLTIGHCEKLDNVYVMRYKNELGMLRGFFKLMIYENPDIVVGYNIFGFDDRYIKIRTDIYRNVDKGIEELERMQQRIRLIQHTDPYVEFNKDSSNTGQNTLYIFDFKGQIRIDLIHQVKENFKLNSYKLDSVSQKFIRGQIIDIKEHTFKTKVIDGLELNQYIMLTNDDEFNLKQTEKILIKSIDKCSDTQKEKGYYMITILEEIPKEKFKFWQLCKDDVSPKQIFEAYQCQNKDEPIRDEDDTKYKMEKRTQVGKYCIMDCYLVLVLQSTMKTVTRTMQMANISGVPYRYIFWKAQGIKIQSLIYGMCLKIDYIFTRSNFEHMQVEGAHVKDPVQGRYKYPVIVFDYEALYPNSIITYNLSPDTFIQDIGLLNQIHKKSILKVEIDRGNKNLNNIQFGDINKDLFQYVTDDVQEGIFPIILRKMINERKTVRKFMKDNDKTLGYDEMQIYDSIQLAIKVVCNSFYGILGAKGLLYCPQIARSTTYFGRKQLEQADNFVTETIQRFSVNHFLIDQFVQKHKFPEDQAQKMKDIFNHLNEVYTYKFKIIYGDTDSIFVYPDYKRKPMKEEKDEISLKVLSEYSIQMGTIVSAMIKKELKGTLNLQFEKILNNFFLFSKKHYIGWLHEKSYEDKKLKYSGIILARRDNPDIVKHLFRLIFMYTEQNDHKDTFKSDLVDYFLNLIKDIFKGKYDKSQFTISKALSREYKNPQSVCHVALANRLRQEKNMVFLSNERIPFIVIYDRIKSHQTNVILSDVIQHPDFLTENDQIDYLYYVVKQVRKPLLELIKLIYNNNEHDDNYNHLVSSFDDICLTHEANRIKNLQNHFLQVKNDNDFNSYPELLKLTIDFKAKKQTKNNQLKKDLLTGSEENQKETIEFIEQFIESKKKHLETLTMKNKILQIQRYSNGDVKNIAQFLFQNIKTEEEKKEEKQRKKDGIKISDQKDKKPSKRSIVEKLVDQFNQREESNQYLNAYDIFCEEFKPDLTRQSYQIVMQIISQIFNKKYGKICKFDKETYEILHQFLFYTKYMMKINSGNDSDNDDIEEALEVKKEVNNKINGHYKHHEEEDLEENSDDDMKETDTHATGGDYEGHPKSSYE